MNIIYISSLNLIAKSKLRIKLYYYLMIIYINDWQSFIIWGFEAFILMKCFSFNKFKFCKTIQIILINLS